MKIARARQLPGQTKEQTRLIAQGIQRGIEQYIRSQNDKTRELDKKLKQLEKLAVQSAHPGVRIEKTVVYRQRWLPWILLILSWLGMGAYWLASRLPG